MPDTHPRILVVSQRGYYMPAFRCSAYAFEDVICAVDHADLLSPGPKCSFSDRVFDRIDRYGKIRVHYKRPRLAPPKLTKYYDILFINVCNPDELFDLEPIWGYLRDRCRLAVCHVEELWANDLDNDRRNRQLEKFDYILSAFRGTCDPLARILSKPVMNLPFGIDMERFCPYPNQPRRSIDVYGMGRGSYETHKALLEWADRTGSMYLYDTASGGNFVFNIHQHRNFTASVIKRSRYFIVNPAKFDGTEERGSQIEVGTRFYEGAGGGAVLIGQRPDCDVFNQHFDWPDAVIAMPFDSTDVEERIRELDAQPARVAQIRVNNVVNCLRRHDWVYRWNYLVKTLGMEPPAAALDREKRLQELADNISAVYE